MGWSNWGTREDTSKEPPLGLCQMSMQKGQALYHPPVPQPATQPSAHWSLEPLKEVHYEGPNSRQHSLPLTELSSTEWGHWEFGGQIQTV